MAAATIALRWMIPDLRERLRHETRPVDGGMRDGGTERGTGGWTNAAEIDVELGADRRLRVRLAGRWDLAGGLPSTRIVEQALRASHPPRAVTFETTRLASWDSSMLLVFRKIDRLCRGLRVPVTLEGLPAGAQRLLALADAVPEKSEAAVPATRPLWLARLGETVAAVWIGARESIGFFGETTLAFARVLTGRATFRARDLAIVVQDCGPQALGIVTLINFLVGVIVAFVGAIELRRFGAGIYVADLVAIATVRELGCIMTGIIMAGRTGSGFAAQLGTMNVNQEIEAFATMGIPPMEFLVVPRMLALCVMMPLLCLYADLIAILGGATVAVGMLGQSPLQYWVETRHAIGFTSIGLGIGKSIVFGALIALAGCLRGMKSGRDAAAVGEAATSAVVLAITWIIATDGLFAVLCDIVGI
jgi:phospholipid/cholesterol/gamma-HCH transport system permease protein